MPTGAGAKASVSTRAAITLLGRGGADTVHVISVVPPRQVPSQWRGEWIVGHADATVRDIIEVQIGEESAAL